jgi:hypothetical protein
VVISASIVLDRSVTQVNQKVRAVCTISNSGANPVTILNAVPKAKSTAEMYANQATPIALAKIICPVIIPAGGSNTLVWDTMFMQPNPTTTYDSPAVQSPYNITCLLYGDDGSITEPTTQTVSIQPNSNYL